MISENDLNRCLEILATLSTTSTRNDRQLLLEMGYIIKQELENVQAWNKTNNPRERGRNIDVNKLLADNTQLYKENQTLIETVGKLKDIIDHKIPQLENHLEYATQKCGALNDILEKM